MNKYVVALLAAGVVSFAATAQAGDGLKAGANLETHYFVTGDEPAGQNESDLQSDFEIYLVGTKQLNHGLVAGAEVVLNVNNGDNLMGGFANSEAGDQAAMEEAYVFLQGEYGRIVLGAQSSSVAAMHVTPGTVGADVSGFTTQSRRRVNHYSAIRNEQLTTNGNTVNTIGQRNRQQTHMDLTGESTNMISYYTPRFGNELGSLQVGVSYATDLDYTSNAVSNEDANTDYAGITAHYQNNNVFGTTFQASVAYSTVDTASSVNEDDANTFSAGLGFNADGFSLGASYGTASDISNNSGGTTNTNRNINGLFEGDSYAVGIGYEEGPYAVSANYFNAEVENGTDEEEEDTYMIAGSYNLGNNVDVVATLGHVEFDVDSVAGDDESTFGSVGLRANF